MQQELMNPDILKKQLQGKEFNIDEVYFVIMGDKIFQYPNYVQNSYKYEDWADVIPFDILYDVDNGFILSPSKEGKFNKMKFVYGFVPISTEIDIAHSILF